MIDHLDNLLRHLLIAGIDEIDAESQVRFDPPDDAWRAYVSNLTVNNTPVNALNCYLIDLREHRKLRSNERIREIENGIVNDIPAPRRMDCHYLITAWSPAVAAQQVEPTIDEHALLYKVAAVLTNTEPLVPRKVYDPDPLPVTFPQVIADAELPTVLLPAEGFPKYGEFWGTMGPNHRWRPAVYYIVTLPVILTKEISGPMVTTRIAEYRFSGQSGIAEIMIEIGGQVLMPAQPIAVGNATVTAPNGGATPTVNNATPFRVDDIVTVNNSTRAGITQIQGNNLRLSPAITGLAVNQVLLIANLQPTQATIRLNNNSTLTQGGIVIITGQDAAPPGNITITERAVSTEINANGFIRLGDDSARACPPRTKTLRLDVAAANAPTLTPLAAGAWVRLEEQGTGTVIETTTTDADGRFRFGGLSEGNYVLRVRAQGFAERTRNITVPSTTGEYDVQLA